MGLLTRLINPQPGEAKLPVHPFMAALGEFRRRAITGAQVVSAFNLNGSEATALQEFLDNLDADTIDRTKVHDVLLLGEAGLYSEAKVKTELGIT